MAAYFKNSKIYNFENWRIHSARASRHVTQFWGNRSEDNVTLAHNVYRWNVL